MSAARVVQPTQATTAVSPHLAVLHGVPPQLTALHKVIVHMHKLQTQWKKGIEEYRQKAGELRNLQVHYRSLSDTKKRLESMLVVEGVVTGAAPAIGGDAVAVAVPVAVADAGAGAGASGATVARARVVNVRVEGVRVGAPIQPQPQPQLPVQRKRLRSMASLRGEPPAKRLCCEEKGVASVPSGAPSAAEDKEPSATPAAPLPLPLPLPQPTRQPQQTSAPLHTKTQKWQRSMARATTAIRLKQDGFSDEDVERLLKTRISLIKRSVSRAALDSIGFFAWFK